MWLIEDQNKIASNMTNYKFWDSNIKAIFDAFNEGGDREDLVSEETTFVDDMLRENHKQLDVIDWNTPQIYVTYNQKKNWKLTEIVFKIADNLVIDIDDLVSKTKVNIYHMDHASGIIGSDRWSTMSEDFEHGGGAFYDESTSSIFVSQKCLQSNLLLAILLHEIGHANDPKFGEAGIDLAPWEKLTDKHWAAVISNNSRMERYAHAFMLNFLRKYQSTPVVKDYIKSAQQLIDHTLMGYKLRCLDYQLWIWKKWIFTSDEYLKLYKKN